MGDSPRKRLRRVMESADGLDVAAAIAKSAGNTQRERVASFFAPYMMMMDPEVESDLTGVEIPGLTGIYHGRDELVGFWSSWISAWDAFRWRSSGWEEIGDSVVIADVRLEATSGKVGAEVGGARFTHLYRFRGDKIVLFRVFRDREEAIRAAEELSTD